MQVGLTGGIASGKSTVLTHFRSCGAATIDADVVAREVVEPGSEGLRRVIDRFGPEYIREDGTLDRAKLGQLVFTDDAQRQVLNTILHPLINARIRQRMTQLEHETPEVPVIVDIPLLIENRLTGLFDRIIVVYIPQTLQIERLMARDGLGEDEALQRIQAQMTLDEKRKYADYVIDNSSDVENTRRQVERIWDSLRREMGQGGLSLSGDGSSS